MKGRRLIIFGVLVAIAAVALTMKPRPKPVQLFDGTLLELTRLKLGTSNAFVHGSALERALGPLLPTNGMQLGRLRLNRPTTANQFDFRESVLSLEFRLSGRPVENGNSRVLSPKFYREFRLVISGDDEFPFVHEFLQTSRFSDGVFLYVNSTCFPRSSRFLHFELQQHDDRLGPWRTVAELYRTNPARDETRKWRAEPAPIQRHTNGVEFLMGTLTVSPHDSNPWEYFWQATVDIPFQVKVNGVLSTNWTLHQTKGEDTSGNSLFIGASRHIENNWSIYRAFRSLDPRKVWRLRADLAPESGFPPDELFTFEIPAPPSGSFVTNFAGVPMTVGWVNVNMLSVELVEKPAGKRLVFVDARDAQGRSIREHSGSWDRARFWRSLKVPERSPSGESLPIQATIALTRNIPIEVTVQPQFIEGSTNRQSDGQ
jgi:hypothetical protein